jgi:hypothetical protein
VGTKSILGPGGGVDTRQRLFRGGLFELVQKVSYLWAGKTNARSSQCEGSALCGVRNGEWIWKLHAPSTLGFKRVDGTYWWPRERIDGQHEIFEAFEF